MTEIAEPLLQPPRWARALMLLALPCDPIRDAILGDLHEEFLDDAMGRGVRSARARYVRRTAGIVVRALADAMILREWVSTGRTAAPSHASARHSAGGGGGGAAGSFAGFVVIALFVLAAAVVVNTIAFSAHRAQGAHGSSAAGIAAVVLLVACVAIGAVVVCVGPRWQRGRRRGR